MPRDKTPEMQIEVDDRSSRMLFAVKCMRPMERYPYETAVFETELSVPVTGSKEVIEEALQAWYKMIEGGIAVSQALAKEKV